MGWTGEVFFGHMSEPTMDSGIVDIVASFAQHDWPITLHSNCDFLRKDDLLSHELSQCVDRFVVGIYDVGGKSEQEIEQQQQWWRQRLAPANVIFSVATTRFQRRFSLEENKKSFPNAGCTAQIGNLVIYYDGEMALCCEDMNCEFDLGNAFETPITELWQSPHHIELVEKLKVSRSHHPICAACPIVPR
jgi:radical SAM protein with 4Fe4S-binding SPASM domain